MIIGNLKKILKQIEINKILSSSDPGYYKIIKIDKKIWLMCEAILTGYDFEADKVLKKHDLGKWNPHQMVVDEKRIWLVSKKYGQLYGVLRLAVINNTF